MQIAKCKTYHAIAAGQSLLWMPDKKSAFKIYYISIIGRDRPDQYEWEHCHQTPVSFEKAFRMGQHEGIGFVMAFPHMTKVFRFSPHNETMLDVIEYGTEDMQPKDCSRGDGSHEFACYAEAMIAADEYEAWAKATTVEEYLAFRSNKTGFPVIGNAKLNSYWEQR
jgi:hypothetical protein